MPVTASKNGIVNTFTCRQWSAMAPGNDGWSVITYDCSGQDASQERTPFASGLGSGGGTGGSSGGDKNYVHLQDTPETTWNVAHGLSKFPAVIIVDSTGKRVIGEIEYTDENNVILTFSAAFGGKAYFN